MAHLGQAQQHTMNLGAKTFLPSVVDAPRAIGDMPFFFVGKPLWRRVRAILGESNTPSLTSGLAVYAVLAELASDAQSQSFSARRGEIASRAGVNVRTVDAVLPVLVKAKVLKIERRRIDDTMNLPSLYTLTAGGSESGSLAGELIPLAGVSAAPASENISLLAKQSKQGTHAHGLKKVRRNLKNTLAPASPTQERDALFIALANAEGSNPEQLTGIAAKSIAVALAQIRRAAPDLTPDGIAARASEYRRIMPSGTRITAHALAKHWARCGGRVIDKPTAPISDGPAGWRKTLDDLYPDNLINPDGRAWSTVPEHIREEIKGGRKELAAS